jgi:hypothetical protein
MGNDVEIEKSLADPTISKNEVISTTESDPPSSEQQESGYQNGDQAFDTGLKPWLQVLGSFFLFFQLMVRLPEAYFL